MTLTKLGAEILRSYVADGVPESGIHFPIRADMRTWFTEIESLLENIATPETVPALTLRVDDIESAIGTDDNAGTLFARMVAAETALSTAGAGIAGHATRLSSVETSIGTDDNNGSLFPRVASIETIISTHTGDIEDIEADITAQASSIASNAAFTNVNAANIAENTADIAANSTAIARNAADIVTNTIDIRAVETSIGTDDNAGTLFARMVAAETALSTAGAGIAGHATRLSSVETSIGTDDNNGSLFPRVASIETIISTHTGDIEDIEADITAQASSIASNAAFTNVNAANIAENTADIAANSTAIARNADDIATHADDIASNTQHIANVYSEGRLRRNASAVYPLKRLERNNITSPSNDFITDALLDVNVKNARRGYYYAIRYFKNGSTALTGPNDGWIIEEQAITGYGSTDTNERVISYTDTTAVDIPREGIQTVNLVSPRRDGMAFTITIDTDALPAYGTKVDMINSGNDGYSHIIDPSCYDYIDDDVLRVGDDIHPDNIPSSQLINKGNDFPLRNLQRNNITSPSNDFITDALLGVNVKNARRGYYYAIRYFKNGSTALTGPNDGWIIEEQAITGYGSTDTNERAISYTDTTAVDIPREGIQTVNLVSPRRDGMAFTITIDTDALPAYGTKVNMINSGNDGYSHIIDPSCYDYIDDDVLRAGVEIAAQYLPSSLGVNKGKDFPLKNIERNGVVSASNSLITNAILDVSIKGAKRGCYYLISYFKNGSSALSGPKDGWIIDEQDILDYENIETYERLITYTDTTAVDIPRDGIQTVNLVSPRRAGFEIAITIDTDALPTEGIHIAMNFPVNDGYSHIIDPVCYEYVDDNAALTYTPNHEQSISYTCSTSGALSIIWSSGDFLYRLTFQKNGYNQLPNIRSIEKAPSVANRADAVWTTVNISNSDWLPPLVVEAVNNGDGGSSIYTGGNHGANGGSGGGNTAQNIMYAIYADHQPLDPSSGAIAGKAKCLTCVIVNELCAHNTTGTVDAEHFPLRYVLRQTFNVHIFAGSIEVNTHVKAYEDIVVKTDNGVQMITDGFQDSLLYVGGQYNVRIAFDSDTVSGGAYLPEYSNAWAVVLQSTNGQLISWIDRDYGLGDGSQVGGTASLIRGGGTGNTKFYHAIITGRSLTMAPGDSYRWRGGYCIQAPDVQSVNFDSTFLYHIQGAPKTALIKNAFDYIQLD